MQLFTYAIHNTFSNTSVYAIWIKLPIEILRPRHHSFPFEYFVYLVFWRFYFSWFVAFMAVSNRDFISFIPQCDTLEIMWSPFDPTRIVATTYLVFLFFFCFHKTKWQMFCLQRTAHTQPPILCVLHCRINTIPVFVCVCVCGRLRLSVVASLSHWTCSYTIHWNGIILIIIPSTFLR